MFRSRLRSLRETLLLPAGQARNDVELAPVGEGAGVAANPLVEVVRIRWREQLLAAGLFLAIALPTATVIAAVVGEWQRRPSQRSWLILGFGFYILTALKAVWSLFVQVCERMLYLRVELSRFVSSTLFEAVTDALAKEAEKHGHTCSWDQEATQEHDSVTGDITIKLRFWSSRSRCLRLCVNLPADDERQPEDRLNLEVNYSPGEDVVCGRDARVQRREVMVFSMRTSSETAVRDKELLKRWFARCYSAYTQPLEGIVNVYALQESSTDWMPEWKFERVKPCKTSSGIGHCFFLQRSSLNKVLADAKLWSNSALRVYMVTGPPGVGKSEFTIWLAGQLRLPVYRLCLSNPRLTDDRLTQLLSQTAINHDSVLVQVDEFQGTLRRWRDESNSEGVGRGDGGVTAGGFCECVQGSTAMTKGVIVLSGTSDIRTNETQKCLPAVFRRIHCVGELSWMTKQDMRCYFRQFLLRFVPGCSSEEWFRWENVFLRHDGPWVEGRSISVDMLKQFLMHMITDISCSGFGDFNSTADTSGGAAPAVPIAAAAGAVASAVSVANPVGIVACGGEFEVSAERRENFFTLICDRQRAECFLKAYAPIA